MGKKPMAAATTKFCFFLFFFAAFLVSCNNAQQVETPSQGLPPSGSWELLRRSLGISAMHMQLLHNDQVVMFDRTDFGPSNLSLPHRCRRDPNDIVLKFDCTAHSLIYDLRSNSFRPLQVQTDTWCSSGAVLPNGTFLQTGGYNDGDRAVRFVSPEPMSDWIEEQRYLAVRRWYATNQILPDGRVIIMGGRREFSYEFFPRQSGSSGYAVDFPFLRDTTDQRVENNLYPFLHLLPDGNLFVFANSRAVILDYINNLVVRTLPPIPGDDPRNYPSTGSSVLLPLRLTTDVTDTVEAEVLVCGGAPRGSNQMAVRGTFVPALRTCGRLAVTDPDGAWWMETMPMERVMGDMLLLPTGDVLIINGAGNGAAGWELGRDPVTRPVLYRTYLAPDRRFQFLTESPIPRMYHSAAIVDTYGRVLVGGSNPHVYYNFTGVLYPTELSLEAFYPPYLDRRFDHYRPSIVMPGPWPVLGYGQRFGVGFTVRDYTPSMGLQVVVMAPPFSTHSLSMNQRMVMLAVEMVMPAAPSTYQISTMAPPTAAIAPPGYYLLFVVHAGVPSTGVWVKFQ